ncbi:MAG: histidine kinase N-terminal 7TM domain-containing protein [Haloarculaceae archaeon]
MATSGNAIWLAHLAWLAFSAIAMLLIGIWVFEKERGRRGVREFLVLLSAGSAWCVTEFVLAGLSDPEAMRATFLVTSFVALCTSFAFVVFVAKYTNSDFHRNGLVRATFAVVLGGYVALALTNQSHHLLFASFTSVSEPFPYLQTHRGPAYQVLVLFMLAAVAYGVVRMGRYLLSTHPRAGLQLALLSLGALSLAALEILSDLGVMPLRNYSYAPYGFLPFSVLTALAVFRFSLLDVQPVARSSVVENLRDPVLFLDADRCLVDHNAASTHVWPEIAAAVGDPFAEACPALAERVDVDAADAEHEEIDLPFDGQDRHYSVAVSVVGTERGVDANWFTVVLRDVTELEQSRRQLETQNERLDQVASTISHDLRNPIQVASGNTEILRRRITAFDVEPGAREDAIATLENTRGSLERMEDIIADILTIAREGKTVEETDGVDLAAVARDAWNNVDTGTGTLTVAGDYQFTADRSKLLTILENLFRNSFDHGPADVTVEIGPTRDSGFYVQDDGPGVPAAEADTVFEYGYTTHQEGTGLGLSIVRTMAESHGWTVTLDTDYESGARFVFGNVRTRPSPDESGEQLLLP